MSSLVTVARAQQAPSLADINATWLASLIEAASTALEKWLRREFASTAQTEVHDGDGGRRIFLRHFPIITLTKVTVTDPYTEEETEYTSTSFDMRAGAGEVRFKESSTTGIADYFVRGFQNVTVEYTSGFATVPADVQEAVVQAIQHFVSAGSSDPAMESEKMGDYQYKRAQAAIADAHNWPRSIRRLVGHYKDHLK